MPIEITGKVHKILAELVGTSANGNQWKKRDFVIETLDQYPKKIVFTVWGDKADELNNFNENQQVTVSFDPESREYNGKWYTDLKAWKIVSGGQANNTSNARQNEPAGDALPEPSYMPANNIDTTPTIDDDLPF
jgi:hypothetical protein